MAETPDDAFEEALGEAKEEGNLSRANVVRKVAAKQTEAGGQHPGGLHAVAGGALGHAQLLG